MEFLTRQLESTKILQQQQQQKELIYVGLTKGKEPTTENPLQQKVEIKIEADKKTKAGQ